MLAQHPASRKMMEYLPITKADQELIEVATSVIRQNYIPGKHHVGAAIRGKSGRIFAGVHLESTITDICAEAVALGMAASFGEREFDCIVAVTMADGKMPRVLSPCGVCRELIRFYGPDVAVIFVENGITKKCRVSDLLPGPYVDS
jgi:cytidine deaminase